VISDLRFNVFFKNVISGVHVYINGGRVILVRAVGYGCFAVSPFYFRFSHLAVTCKSKSTFGFLKHIISGVYVYVNMGQAMTCPG
jgi:hypothetical protein